MLAFTADNHIGITAQWSIKERKDDFMNAFHNMVDTLIKSRDNEKSLIIGGDLFDTAYPPSFAVEFVQNEIRRLSKSGFSVFGIDGNHDIADGKWLRVCGITPLSDDPVLAAGARVCGINYSRSSDIIECLNNMADRGVKCDILVLHLAFGELNRMGAASDLAASDIMPALKALGIRRVLMGHIHIRQAIEIDGITFSYCGSTELCSINEPKDKSYDIIDTNSFRSSFVNIETRPVENAVIGNEKEFATYEASLQDNASALQDVYVVSDVKDGVKRLRKIAKDKNILMRVQVIHPHAEAEASETIIDRTTGVIGLEQAICLSFAADSEEADLIRAILRSPESMKVTVDNYMKKENI